MIELTNAQIDRQDMVDNAIYDLICDLNPARSGEKIKWDIEVIGRIRDALSDCYVSLGLCTEMEFYPYILWDDYEIKPKQHSTYGFEDSSGIGFDIDLVTKTILFKFNGGYHANLKNAPAHVKNKVDKDLSKDGITYDLETGRVLSGLDDLWEDESGESCPECGLGGHLWNNSSGDMGCENCGWQEGQI